MTDETKIRVPPIKSQGIKTKLVPWIRGLIPNSFSGTWIEPFMGTGAVAFNVASPRAILCDTNPHLIRFYRALQSGEITPDSVAAHLRKEGAEMRAIGEAHYYKVRERFNETKNPLDFLFLNRAGFNGMIRFNRRGDFNVPFCKKSERFAAAYVTKIVNQVDYVRHLFRRRQFDFLCQDFEKTIGEAGPKDMIYCDPPYINRHADYFNGWDGDCEESLFSLLKASRAPFILSTWHHNDFRENPYVNSLWKSFNILTREHYYHVGGREANRNPMVEALITNFDVSPPVLRRKQGSRQLDFVLK